MSTWKKWLVILACSPVLPGLSGLGLSAMAQETSNETQAIAARQTKAVAATQVDGLPDSPGASQSQKNAATLLQIAQSEPAGDTISPQGAAQSVATQAPGNQPTNNPAPPQRPVGTAAAEAPTTSGIAASEPAGVAIAPAKQHRARTIIIRTGAIIGAAVAVGVVVGLTEATSSKPPGAH